MSHDRSEVAPARRAADRGLLLERAVVGLAHEGKNPLNSMLLHLQLLAEKTAEAEAAMRQGAPAADDERAAEASSPATRPAGSRGSNGERHLRALRNGIHSVDALLRAFAELAVPPAAADLGASLSRACLVLAFEARRRGVTLVQAGSASLRVAAAGELVSDLTAHAVLAFIALSREGGEVHAEAAREGDHARLTLRAEPGGAPAPGYAAHLGAAQRLAAALRIELHLPGVQAGARLSLALPFST